MHDTDNPLDANREDLHLAQAVLAPDGLPTMSASPREHFAPLVDDRLICLTCRWYMDMLTPSGDRGPDEEDPRLLQRWCLRHGDLDLTDGEVFACSGYFPRRWWTVAGWRRWAHSRALIRHARAAVAARTIENARARGIDYGDFTVNP